MNKECNKPENSPTRKEIVALFLIGTLFALAMQTMYAFKHGENFTRLIHVKETSHLAKYVASEFPDLSFGTGHDGQFFYAIARNPFGNSELLTMYDSFGFRYRRWLYPLLAGGFGTFSPQTTLGGLIILNALSIGACLSLFYILLTYYNLSLIWAVGLLIHPGILTSAVILTADNMAFALSLLGLILFLTKRMNLAIFTFALAALTKDAFLFFPFAISLHLLIQRKYRDMLLMGALPTFPLIVWMLTYTSWYPSAEGNFSALGNFSLPFEGILSSYPHWIAVLHTQYGIFPVITFITLLIATTSSYEIISVALCCLA